ncbi:MAG: RNA polymerase sigma factor [Actinomycetota bacterium]
MQSGGASFSTGAYIPPSADDWNSDETESARAERVERTRQRWLIERAQQGDKDAFGDLYRICHPSVARIVGFYLPGAAGEDAVQETFVRAWSALPRYKDIGAPFTAWLGGIARHVVGDALRAAKRTRPQAEAPEQPVTHELDDNIDLARVIAQLPKKQQQVVELKFLLGWSNEMVAQAMGKTPGAINVLQWRALERMRKLMSQ